MKTCAAAAGRGVAGTDRLRSRPRVLGTVSRRPRALATDNDISICIYRYTMTGYRHAARQRLPFSPMARGTAGAAARLGERCRHCTMGWVWVQGQEAHGCCSRVSCRCATTTTITARPGRSAGCRAAAAREREARGRPSPAHMRRPLAHVAPLQHGEGREGGHAVANESAGGRGEHGPTARG